MDVLTFQMQGDPYGVELKDVDEVLHMATCRPLPGAPPFVAGVLNLRGDLLPVVDLTRRLGFARRDEDTEDGVSPYPKSARLLITTIGDNRVAMVLDGWEGVITIDTEQMRNAVVRAENMPDYINGIGIVEETGASQTLQMIKIKGAIDQKEVKQLAANAKKTEQKPTRAKKRKSKPGAE